MSADSRPLGLRASEAAVMDQPLTVDPHEIVGLLLDLAGAREALRRAHDILVFADGQSVVGSGFALADLYAEDCDWAQDTLRAAGCHPRGRMVRWSTEGVGAGLSSPQSDPAPSGLGCDDPTPSVGPVSGGPS